MEDLRGRAAALQDRLSDLHTEYMQSPARKTSPQEAAVWQRQWEQQVRNVTAAQTILKAEGVDTGTAETLAGAERAAGVLKEKLEDLKSTAPGGT